MHICFLTSEYPREGQPHGGIGSFVKFLAKKLIDKGINVSVIGINNSYKNEIVEENGINIYRLKKSKWKFAKFYQQNNSITKKLKEIHAENKIDIVEGSELNFAFFSKKTPYKKVIRLHGGHHFFAIELGKKTALWRGLQEKKSFKNADSYIAVSNYVGEQTKKYLNYNFNYTTIYNTINSKVFSNSNSIPQEKSLLFVGTVCQKKGVKELIEAINIVVKEIPEISLTIVGRDWLFKNGSSYIEYVKTFISADSKQCIKFIGAVPQNELPNYISNSAICIFPSHMESFGLTLLEAVFMDKIVLASDIETFNEIKGNLEGVLSIENINAQEISERIIYVFNNYNKVKSNLAPGIKDILNRFNEDKIVKQNINFYNNVRF
ncbi:MAG: glycosyltransferase family 4 protein [Polaribacter sp.]|uniref:glycosyltransferase family 4 protein n=1 Tax=Polaribacter sp. TaxID=1920175 RepID=UPI002F355C70